MNRLASFFKIRHGEAGMVGLLTALMFFPSLGGAIGSPSIEALFYTRFGVDYLPYMYIALGAVTLIITLLITAVMGRLDRKILYQTLPALLALALTVSRILVGFDLSWFYPPLWLGMYILWTFQILLTWGTASMVCDTRQAKRLFPLFSSGGILGAAVGGLVTKALVRWIGTENLLFVWVGTLIIAFLLIHFLIKDFKEKRGSHDRRRKSLTADLGRGYQYVWSSGLMRRISLTVMLLGLLYFMIAFPFSRAAAAQFPDEDMLAGFFGIFFGVTTATALLASLLLANRFYARFGFMTAILVFPIIYFVGFSALAVRSAFSMLIAFRFLQMSWMQGVSGPAYQAVFNIVPSERREQSRVFIDGVSQQIGVMLAGFLLVISLQVLQPRLMFVIGIAVAAAAIFSVWLAKRNYSGALVDALRTGHPSIFFSEEEPFCGFQKDTVAVSTALAGISDPDLRVRRIAAEILGNLSLPEAIDALVKALDDPDIEVRVALLRSLAKANAAHALLEISAFLEDPEPEVRLQSIKTLAQLAPYAKGLIAHVQPLLDDNDSRIRSTAASTLLNLGPHNKAFNILNEMIRSPEPQTQILALEAFADWGGEAAYDLVKVYLNDPSANIRRKALVAINHIDPQRSLDRLIEALGDEDRFVVETSASEFKKAGPQAFKRLIEALNNSRMEEGALQALKHLPFRREVNLIRQYARAKVAEMKRYDKLYRHARQQNRNLKYYELLLESIQNCARIQSFYALKAVGLIEDVETVDLAIECLNTEDTEQKANALEMLDSIGEREIVSHVLQHWESASTGVEKEIRASGPDPSSWMINILQDEDPWLRACAVLAITDLEDPQMHDTLEHLASDPDSLVRETALNALKGGAEMKTLPTLSMMERIIFLRRVPIFSQLPPAELKQIAAICVEQDFLDGEIFAQEGELGDEMYIIVSGEIRVVTGGEQGPGIELARRRSGDYVGEMSIISNEPRMATLIADGNIRTLCISQKQFEQILRQRPETSLAVMRVLCSRLREVQNP